MDNLNEVKIMLTGAVLAVVGLIGWQGVLVLVWLALMMLDYASGWLAAKKTKTWKSEKARDGIMHKGGMVLVVLASALTDGVLWIAWEHIGVFTAEWPWLLMALTVAWYCLTEVGSIGNIHGPDGKGCVDHQSSLRLPPKSRISRSSWANATAVAAT